VTFDPQEVKRLLAESDQAATATARGAKYEDLLAYVFDSVPDSLVVRNKRNFFGAEQIDLAVSHGGGFPGLPEKFLVECKNYGDPVDSKAIGYFLFICLSRSAELAIVAAAEGLSGNADDMTYAHSLAIAASALGCRLVVITTADLLSLGTVEDLQALLRERFLSAWATGGVGA
jgi:hypothetical protein